MNSARSRPHPALLTILLVVAGYTVAVHSASVVPVSLRCEYRLDPAGVETPKPRLSWRLDGSARGARQTAWRVRVASRESDLTGDRVGDLWDSGKVEGSTTAQIEYSGARLHSRQVCWWQVQVWDEQGNVSAWSPVARWSMGLQEPGDWTARWIAELDDRPFHTNRNELCLPPARYFQRDFDRAPKRILRATVYASALGHFTLEINGQRVGDSRFEPGWSDYRHRVYYRTHELEALPQGLDVLKPGRNRIGAILTDGWYAGYLGYGLLVGYGPYATGRSFYGRTPALLVQLEIEYEDGSRQVVGSDEAWRVSRDGPVREADLLMGERYDARRFRPDWSLPGGAADWDWRPAVPAEHNGSFRVPYVDRGGRREVELGFQRPGKLQSYPAQPVRAQETLLPVAVTQPSQGVSIFDLGQNIAGVARIRVRGKAGATIELRYGEMLHPDGRLMTENLRRARARDTYILAGTGGEEIWTPEFTYHGFRYVEVSGLSEPLDPAAVEGVVLHSDTPLTSRFECSDPVINRLFKNIVWTQRANFIEVPTDCPQRDERLGWMGDAQIYVGTATYNADVAAFFTKWLDDVEEAQRSFGAYPDYAPYPMMHGQPGKSFGTAWMDAGIICPWTIHRVYGDCRIIERHWDSMTRFMEFRQAATAPDGLGVSIGNPWGDWLNLEDPTPVEYIDTCYHAATLQMMAEMAEAIGRPVEAADYRARLERVRQAFREHYVGPGGSLNVESQTAHVLALWSEMVSGQQARGLASRLADKVRANDCRMTTGFLGTKPLLPVLSAWGEHDLAIELFQSRRFPSWGYEVVNGATTIWERWDSYTHEEGFGRHNAAMNSFSHYAFGAVGEWMFRSLVGIESREPGYSHVLLRPGPPSRPGTGEGAPVSWVDASYDAPPGTIRVRWERGTDRLAYEVNLPPNTSATLHLPCSGRDSLTEGGQPVAQARGVHVRAMDGDRVVIDLDPGSYVFNSEWSP